MASNKGNFKDVLFAPFDFLGVPFYLCKLHIDAWTTHVPKFNGNPWLASRYLASFMDYVVDNNIVYEHILMKAFAYFNAREDAWDWYCDLKPKEIKSFPHLMKRFQKHWIYGYEEVEDACVFLIYKKKWGKGLMI
jgi:hypothetical protein